MLPLPPGLRLDPTLPAGAAFFDVKTWEIVLNEADFTSPVMTAGGLSELGGLAVHEAEHGGQYLDAARYHIQTAANPNAAVADLKFVEGWDADAVDLAAGSAPLDPAGMSRAKAYHDEFLGGKKNIMAQAEGAILKAPEALKAAQADWRFRKAIVDGMWQRREMGDQFTRACEGMTKAFNDAAEHEKTIRTYYDLAIEQGAYGRQDLFRYQEELRFAKQAREEMDVYMQQLVALGVLSGGIIIGAGITGYVVTQRHEPAPAHR
jgi:hypothetical protein